MAKIVTECLIKNEDIDKIKVGEALQILQKYPKDSIIDFNIAYEGDTEFTVYYYREQTEEEYLRYEKELQTLVSFQKEQERKEYERLKAKFEN